MKKLVFLVLGFLIFTGVYAQHKSPHPIDLAQNIFYFNYQNYNNPLADTVSTNDSVFSVIVSINGNTGSALFYNMLVHITKVSGTGSCYIYLQGKQHTPDSWTTITATRIAMTGIADTTKYFDQTTTYQTYNFYRIMICRPSGTLKVYPFYIDGFFKRVLGSTGGGGAADSAIFLTVSQGVHRTQTINNTPLGSGNIILTKSSFAASDTTNNSTPGTNSVYLRNLAIKNDTILKFLLVKFLNQ